MKMVKKGYCLGMGLLGFFLNCGLVFAQVAGQGEAPGFGGLASELTTGPMQWMIKFFYGSCYVIGGIMVWKSYELYKGHRANPTYIGFYSVAFMFVIGVVALLIPLAHYLTVVKP
jgi:hypothetical protein